MAVIFKKTPKKLRLEKHLLQKDVAKKLKMCPSVYSLKENGKRKWSLIDAARLSKLYGVKIDNLKI